MHAGIGAAAEAERDIVRALRQVDQGEVGRDVELDIRMGGPEPVQAGREPARDVGRYAGDADAGALPPVDAGDGPADLVQPAPHAGGQPFALRRHLDAARVPHEESEP